MSTRRRQAFGVVEVTAEWPAVMADPDAPVWTSSAASREWLTSHGVDVAQSARSGKTPAQRRARAIKSWAHAHHPSSRWPNFIDQHWMNASGLRQIEQQADRIAYREALGIGDTP